MSNVLNSPVFRMAALDDVDDLVSLRVLMQQEIYDSEKYPLTDNYLNLLREYFAKKIESKGYVSAVADLNGKLVSANGLILYQKPPAITGGNGLIGYISNVYTVPAWRRKGIGKELMKMLVEHARQMEVTELHLWSTEDGKGVYQSLGFGDPDLAALQLHF